MAGKYVLSLVTAALIGGIVTGFFPDGSRAVFCVFHHAFSPFPFAVSV